MRTGTLSRLMPASSSGHRSGRGPFARAQHAAWKLSPAKAYVEPGRLESLGQVDWTGTVALTGF